MATDNTNGAPALYLDRRQILGAGLALMAGAAAPQVLAMGDSALTAKTKAGFVRGTTQDGILNFKGVRYGATTAGRRFQPPRAPDRWDGVKDALDYGNQSPQQLVHMAGIKFFENLAIDRPISEDCLFLNVWTPALRDGKKRPVMVWLHGGGFNEGSGASVLYDGMRLSRRGDVVVVTVNHRLNVFGYLYLAGLDSTEYTDSGNVGMLDLVLALQWVRDNAVEFGGDAGNVTIFGESGGGGKVTTLMAMPAAKGLFHKAVVESGSLLKAKTPEAASQTTKAIMDGLGLRPSQVRELATVPVDKLVDSMKTAGMTGLRLGPVVDGRSLPRQPFDPDAPEISKNVPLLVGTNKDEVASLSSLFIGPDSFDLTDATLRERFAKLYPGKDVDGTLAALKRIYPFAKSSDLLFTITSWTFMRNNAITQAERKADQRGAPAYMYVLRWESPVENGKWKSPHALELPMVFDTVATAPGMVGTGGQAQRVADAMSTAWVDFARTGSPGWPAYDTARRMTMVFDASSEVVADPDSDERRLFHDWTSSI